MLNDQITLAFIVNTTRISMHMRCMNLIRKINSPKCNILCVILANKCKIKIEECCFKGNNKTEQ